MIFESSRFHFIKLVSKMPSKCLRDVEKIVDNKILYFTSNPCMIAEFLAVKLSHSFSSFW